MDILAVLTEGKIRDRFSVAGHPPACQFQALFSLPG